MDVLIDFVDDYDHLDADLDYILENVVSEELIEGISECNESKELNEHFNTLLLNKCECDAEQKLQSSKCSHGSNYIFNEEFRELVLNDLQDIPDLIYECSNMCKCKKKCRNRLVQYGPRKYLKIVHSEQYCSKGLITLRDVPKGAFICEYAGELLTCKEAKKNIKLNDDNHKMNYILFLKESSISQKNETFLTIVDPSRKGNIGRYLNHSCEPNCHIISVRIDCPIPKIGKRIQKITNYSITILLRVEKVAPNKTFFSNRYIQSGEEICFNYNEGVNCKQMESTSANKRIPCLCGSRNCTKYLPNSDHL